MVRSLSHGFATPVSGRVTSFPALTAFSDFALSSETPEATWDEPVFSALAKGVISEAFRDPGELKRMGMVFPGLFAAEARARENLCRVRQLFRIERTSHPLHGFEVRLGKHLRHHHLFLF